MEAWSGCRRPAPGTSSSPPSLLAASQSSVLSWIVPSAGQLPLTSPAPIQRSYVFGPFHSLVPFSEGSWDPCPRPGRVLGAVIEPRREQSLCPVKEEEEGKEEVQLEEQSTATMPKRNRNTEPREPGRASSRGARLAEVLRSRCVRTRAASEWGVLRGAGDRGWRKAS